MDFLLIGLIPVVPLVALFFALYFQHALRSV